MKKKQRRDHDKKPAEQVRCGLFRKGRDSGLLPGRGGPVQVLTVRLYAKVVVERNGQVRTACRMCTETRTITMTDSVRWIRRQ